MSLQRTDVLSDQLHQAEVNGLVSGTQQNTGNLGGEGQGWALRVLESDPPRDVCKLLVKVLVLWEQSS